MHTQGYSVLRYRPCDFYIPFTSRGCILFLEHRRASFLSWEQRRDLVWLGFYQLHFLTESNSLFS